MWIFDPLRMNCARSSTEMLRILAHLQAKVFDDHHHLRDVPDTSRGAARSGGEALVAVEGLQGKGPAHATF